MYESQTYEAIFQRMLSNISDDIDKREGSVAYDMLAPKAAELAVAYIELDNILKFGFVNTTYGQYLDSKVLEIGLVRELPVKSTGIVKFMGTNGIIIPVGTVVSTDSGVQFQTTQSGTISGGLISLEVIAVTAGIIGNVAENSIINTTIENVTCTNVAVTSGGKDEETDESLLQRYIKKVTMPSLSGNANNYYDWALEVIGIGDAKIIPIWNGGGTVKVILIGTDKGPVTGTKVTEVYDYIETKRPIGATVTVISAVNKVINVSAQLTLQGGITIGELTPVITTAIQDYFKSAAFVDIDIKYSKIGSILLQIDGIVDYTNLQLNGATANIVLAENEVPSLGTVTLT